MGNLLRVAVLFLFVYGLSLMVSYLGDTGGPAYKCVCVEPINEGS